MNPEQFFQTVCRMRDSQKEYFKTRSRSSLEESKRLEKLIDDEIARVGKIKPEAIPKQPTQGSLFNHHD